MPLVVKVESADVLTEVLSTLGIQGRVFCRSELSAPWSLDLSPSGFAHFHVVERGEAWIRLEKESTAVELRCGDLIILPHGGGHVLYDHPHTPPVPLDQVLPERSAGYPLIRHGGGGAETQLICGSFQFENAAESPLLSLLPSLIHVGGSGSEAESWLASTLQILAFEARQPRPGAKTVISRLTEIIFVQAVRAWMENQPADQRGWLGALRDTQIGAALELIHRAPERSWSVAMLAREVAMSRSPFAARFQALVGEPPLAYLTRWRMHRAARLLQSDNLSVGEVAERVGYESAAAFSKAFRRRFSLAPSVYRQAAVPTESEPSG
jgi:AraC family transcriptional regulator, alkane utilization regulator